MRVHLAIIFSLIFGPAMAEGTGDVQFSTVVPAASQPVSIGIPHICAGNYPAAAIKALAEGTTTLSFTVTSAGTVANLKVAKSSGNADLDDASVQCAVHWLYQPATQYGKPIDVPWQANVSWKLHGSPAEDRAQRCMRYAKGPVTIPPNAGMTSLTFRVMPDGTMKDAAISHSSGDSALDDVAIQCAAATHFDTSIITLPPEGVPGHADLDWSHVSPPPAPTK
jgi:TonB family protein